MFGYTRIKESDLKALNQAVNEAAEIKGYYSNVEGEINEYLKMISQQLVGVDMGRISGLSRDQIKDAYESCAPVAGIINYIADNIGEVSRYLELRDRRTGEYIEKHPILDLLTRPNDRFTQRKFFTAWGVNRELFDDAFTYAPKSKGKDRMPKSMYIIPGQRVILEKGGYEHPLKGMKLVGSAGDIQLEDNFFESFGYNLDDSSFFGSSKIAAAAVYLTVIERSMNREATALKNGGPASIITPSASSSLAPLAPQLDDMEQKFNGERNVNKHLVLKTAIDVHTLGDKPADLSILDSHKDAINVLCFLYKIPVDLYLGQAKYENAKEAKKTIYEQLAIPRCNEFAEDLLHYLGMDGDYILEVNKEKIDVLKRSNGETLDDLAKMHASLNELREANDYPRIEEDWADQPMLPMGIQFGNESFDISE